LDAGERDLMNIVTRVVQDGEAVESVKNAREIGVKAYEHYVQERLVTCQQSIYKTIPKNNLKIFRGKKALSTNKGKLKAASIKEERKMYASLYVASQVREGDLDDFFKHENHEYPPTISEYGNLRKTSKSDFLKCLEEFGETKLTPPEVSVIIIDAAVLVQIVKPQDSKNFGQYSDEEFPLKALRKVLVMSPFLELT
jgi:hypothetical protein